MTPPERLRSALRLIVVTDAGLAAPASVTEVVEAALEAGARAVQLRDKEAGAGALLSTAETLLALCRRHDALLFVNDRLDVALAVGADGVHLGPTDLPVAVARARSPDDFLIGYSTDDPVEARRAETAGADYIGCGAVFGTWTKDVGGEAIGPGRLDEVARSVSIPVVGIGGVGPANVARIAATAAAGSAVVGAIMGSDDPGAAVRALLDPFREEVVR